MKTTSLLLLIFFSSIVAFAQDREEIQESFWGQNDTYKSILAIPEKWKNESAVVIYKNENYDYHKFGMNITYISSVRKRIKLLDKAAVTEFSEFSFKEQFRSERGISWKKGKNVIGIKVIKPDGSEREINIDEEAVEVDEKKKVAISNLEIGDIIDYYYHATEFFKSVSEYGFDPVETTLGDEYPIMNLKITLKTENDFFVNFNTYNGAPAIQQINVKGKDNMYELTATDIEKDDFPRWFYPLVELPTYKFQVYFARNGRFQERAAAFLPKKADEIKKSVTKEDVLEHYDSKFRPYGDLGQIERFLKGMTFKNDEEKVRAVYYYTRHQYLTRYIEAMVVKQADIMYPWDLYGKNAIFFNNEVQFIDHFMAFLKDNHIDYDVVITTPRYNGPIKDLLIEDNIEVVLKVLTENPVYLQFFTPFTNADQINYSLEGTEAYALKVSKRKKITDVENIKLPTSTYKENLSDVVIKTELSDDFSSLLVTRKTALTGHNKDREQSDKMYFFDYVEEDYTKYETTPLMELVKNKKKKEQYTSEFEALKNKLKDKQKEEFKKSAESELEVTVDDHTFEIVNTGRYGKDVPFSYIENFKIKDNLIKKAGPNYVLEIGRLIGSQVTITEKEKERTANIYSVFPRSYMEEIRFKIPAGYSVSGLDKLNKKVENITGGFESTATIEGDMLIVKAHKHYNNYYEPNSNWDKMMEFLDAAFQFTQEKVLLKKN